MNIYTAALKNTIRPDSLKDKEISLQLLIASENLIQPEHFLQFSKSFETDERENELLKLQELQYSARFGNYMKFTSSRTRIY